MLKFRCDQEGVSSMMTLVSLQEEEERPEALSLHHMRTQWEGSLGGQQGGSHHE